MSRFSPPLLPTFLFLFLVCTATTGVASLPLISTFSLYKNVISLSHSLLLRVSNLRVARGDIAGANRAKLIAEKLEKGLGVWGWAWSAGWDYLKNYAWRELDYTELHGIVSDLNELARSLGQLTREESEVERASWIVRNYSNVLRIAKSVFKRSLLVFHRSGVLKEVAEAVQREVIDGGLLRDCLELGSNDLKGLVQIVKDLASQFYSTSDYHSEL